MSDRTVAGRVEQRALEAALDAAIEDRNDAALSYDHGQQSELQELVAVAMAVRTSASRCAPSVQLRSDGRARVLAAIAVDEAALRRGRASPARPPTGASVSRLRLWITPWIARAAAVVATLSAAGVATASAAGAALPGDGLYPLKQAGEVVLLELSGSDAARAQRLAEQAETRLDEVVRLAEAGRSAEAAAAATWYEQAMDRAAAARANQESRDNLELSLESQRARLEAVLDSAPAPAQPGLQRAIAATQRGQSRAADGPSSRPEHPSAGATADQTPASDRAPASAVDQEGQSAEDPHPGIQGLGHPQEAPSPTAVALPQESHERGGVGSPADHSSAADKATPARSKGPASPGAQQPERADQAATPAPAARQSEPARKPDTPPGRRQLP